MKKKLRLLGLGLLAVFIAIQFVRPARNISTAPTPNDIARKYQAPDDVQRVLTRACYDCHSNHTRYPWYAEIQPVGWWLTHHANEGKSQVNFSAFGLLTRKRAASRLEAIVDAVSDGVMPLKSYTWLHPEARLTDAEKALLTNWAEELAAKIKHP